MKYCLILLGILFVAPQSAPANTPAYAHCGTYDSYILLYKSIQEFEELGKLHCGERVAITGQDGAFTQVQTTDGRYGWVPTTDLSTTAPSPHTVYTFGWTEKPKPEPQPEPAPEPNSGTAADQLSSQPSDPIPAQAAIQQPNQPIELPSVTPVVARVSDSAPLLTNVNVTRMQGAHLSPDAIITRLNASRCDFDTSPAALHRLKLSGVSDRIILAMMHAPAAYPTLTQGGAPTIEVKIPDQTPVQVAVSSDVGPDNLREGSVVEMAVVEPVTLNGVTVIPRGAEARARIMAVRRASMGSSGQVVWFMQDVTAATGDHIPASFAAVQDSNAVIGRFAGYPYFLSEYRKGAPAIAVSSGHYIALVDGNIPLRLPRATGVALSADKPQVQPQPVSQVIPAVTTAPVFPVVVQTPDQQAVVKP